MTRRLYYTDHFTLPLPEGHRFPMAKYRMVRDLLTADGIFEFEPAPLAEPRIVQFVHDPEYVEAFMQGLLTAHAIRRIGFPWSGGLVRRTLASVGGTLAATEDALARGWGGNLAGGTHHAFRAEGSGFCVFNDIAVAIESLRTSGRVQRAAVVVLDVHQGDGTAQIFQERDDVLTLSIHCEVNFPFRKQQSRIDVALAEGVEDDEYLRVLADILPRVWQFRPDIVFYQSGVDSLFSDALGKLRLTHEGLRRRDRCVMEAVREQGIPLVITMGGGYSKPIENTALAHANTFRMAAEVLG